MKDLFKHRENSENTGTSQSKFKYSEVIHLQTDLLEVCINLKFSFHLTRFGNNKMCEKVAKFIFGEKGLHIMKKRIQA